MAYKELSGNIFISSAKTFVNTVNCVGAMGKGIALEFRRRFPDMFIQYQKDCEDKKIVPGRIYSYPIQSGLLVLNFAIKDDWKYPSKIEWIESCLKQFVAGYQQKNIKSIAFPWMGAMNGGIPLSEIKNVTRKYLQNLPDIEIEIYEFDPNASDPLFDLLKKIAHSNDPSKYYKPDLLQRKVFDNVIQIVKEKKLNSFSQLDSQGIIGKISTDKLYYFLTKIKNIPEGEETSKQLPLFDNE